MPIRQFSRLWFSTGVDVTTPDELRRNMTRIIHIRAYSLLLVWTLIAGAAVAAGILDAQYLLVLLGLSAFVTLGLWLNLRPSRPQSGLVLVLLSFGIGVYGSLHGGLLGTSLLFYVLSALLASHLMGLRAMWIIVAVSVLGHFGIVLGRTPHTVQEIAAAVIPVSGAMLGIALLESYVTRMTVETLKLMESNTRALEDEIVERFRVEEALRESERRYREAVEVASDVILTINAEGYYTFANAAAIRLSGYSLDEFRGMVYTTLVEPEYQRLVKQHFLRQYLERTPLTYGEYPFRTKPGKVVWLGYNVSLLIEQGSVRGFHVVGRDITEQKRYEDALQRSEQQYRRLFELANDAIIVTDFDEGVVLDVNRRACEMYGLSREEFIGRPAAPFAPSNGTGPSSEAGLTDLRRHGEHEAEHQRSDGSPITVLINSSVIDFDGRRALLSINRDITEHKRSEAALRHAQKMESLGVLAGGIAHDFNNLLQAIMGQSALALQKMESAHEAFAHISKAEKAATRAAELTQQLLAYSGRGRLQVRRLQMNDLLQENLHLLEVSIPKSVRLEFVRGADLWDVEADAGQMQQLAMNLIINAGEAVGASVGRIAVRTGMVRVKEGDRAWPSKAGDNLQPGSYVVMEVEDNGCGMSSETMEKIFDPFFTTKFTGRGLGLAAVLGIVRGHKGGLQVESVEGAGTTFRVALPGTPPVLAGGDSAKPQSTGSIQGTVLVIDDEAIVREVVRDILASEGVRILEAPDGRSGVETFLRHRNDIDLVLLDLSMPGISGEETLRLLRKEAPDVRVVLSSGYSETEAMEHLSGSAVAGFLQKPYRGDVLLGLLKQLL